MQATQTHSASRGASRPRKHQTAAVHYTPNGFLHAPQDEMMKSCDASLQSHTLTGLDEEPLRVRADLPLLLHRALECLSIRSGAVPAEVWSENGLALLHALASLGPRLVCGHSCRTLVALASERLILQTAQRSRQGMAHNGTSWGLGPRMTRST